MQGIKAARPLLLDYLAAMNQLEGLPRRSRVIGGPDDLPRVYSSGAPGWTANVSEIFDTVDARIAIQIPDDARKHLGKAVRVGSKTITIPSVTTTVVRKPESRP